MPAGRVVSKGDQLVDFKVDPTGIALRAQGSTRFRNALLVTTPFSSGPKSSTTT
jgi:hypothetical protein